MWYNGTGKKLHNLPHSSWLCKDLFHCLSFFQVIRYTFPFTLFSSLASQLLLHWFKTSTSSDNLDYSLDIKTLSQVGQNKGKCQLHLPSNRSWVTTNQYILYCKKRIILTVLWEHWCSNIFTFFLLLISLQSSSIIQFKCKMQPINSKKN